MAANEYGISFWGDKNVLKLNSGNGYKTFCEYTKNHFIVHIERLNSISYISIKLLFFKETLEKNYNSVMITTTKMYGLYG